MVNVTNPYATADVTVSLKRVKVISLMEWAESLTPFDQRAAVREVNRALNAWHYQERISA